MLDLGYPYLIPFLAQDYIGRVQKMELDKDNPNPTFITNEIIFPVDIEVYEEYMYICEYKSGIVRIRIDSPVSTSDYNSEKIKIFPNPTSDFVALSGLDKEVLYSIVDVKGNVRLQGNVGPNEKIDISSLSRGTYFVLVDNRLIGEVVKQ